MTISASISVTPRSLFIAPANDVRIIPIPSRLAVGAERNDVGVFAVIARVFVQVVAPPRIERDILREIGTGPVVHVCRLDTQRLQALPGGRINTGIQLINAERIHEGADLRPRGSALGA